MSAQAIPPLQRAVSCLPAIVAAVAFSTPARALTATTVTGSASPAIALSGSPVTLSATIDAAGLIFIAPPSGSVAFSLDGLAIPGCTAVPFTELVTPRTTTCTISAPAAGGVHWIDVQFSGNASLAPSANYFELTVPSSYPVDSPLPFAPNAANSTFGALVTSQPVALSGFTGTRTISVAGGQYSIGCTASYTTAAGTVQPNDILCVRHVTPQVNAANTQTKVTIGTIESSFDSDTGYWYDAPFGQEATIAAGISHTLAQPQSGNAVAWGDNTGGKLGIGTTASTSVPTETGGSALVVAAGLEHSILANGGGNSATYAMGLDTAGQLGVGGAGGSCTVTGEPGLFPCAKQPGTLGLGIENIVAVGAGWRHSLALKSDGTVWAWGSGYYGQNGKTADQSTPARVNGINGTVVRIAAGYMHSAALLENGTVVAWGSNQFGELGPNVAIGTGKNPTPVPVPNLTNVVDIAAGASYTLALKSDGTVWSWGANIYGQLGDPAAPVKTAQNTAGFRAMPTQIPGLTGVRQIAAGFSFAFARKNDGSIVSWGLNKSGQANGTPRTLPMNCGAALGHSCILSPTAVPGSSGYQQMYAGGAHTVLVDGQGRLKLFGDNSSGQLANRSGNFGAKFAQTTYDPDTFLNPAGVGGTPANVGRPDTAGGLNLGNIANGIDFGSQSAGIPSAPVVLSLNNLSTTQALLVDAINVAGYDVASEFSATHNCPLAPASLPAGASCLIDITFTPTAFYDRTGFLVIYSNATDSSAMDFRLAGTGVDPRAESTITLASPNGFTAVVGTPVTFNATVTSGAPVTGTVSFGRFVGTYPLTPITGCVDLPVVAGVSSCTTSALAEGFHQVGANYSGSATVQPSFTYNLLGISITPVVTTYRLTVASLSGPSFGVGTVTSVPAGINNCVACSADFPAGTVVTLSATPGSPGSIFAGWSGDCTGTGTCVVTMSANRNVTTAFPLVVTTGPVSLTVAKAGSGSGTVSSAAAGIDCGVTCTAVYGSGASVTLTATPASGSVFSGWSGACTGTGTCNVTMIGPARNVTATFTKSFELSVGKVGVGTGVVTSTPAGINCGRNCVAPFASGAVVALTAAANAGSTFVGWGGACAGTGACNVTMDAARSVTATFSTPNANIPRLVNISTRLQVQTGNSVLIGGFVIGGTRAKTIVVRARGPSLAPFGITNALADPKLELFAGQTPVDSNDDWQAHANADLLRASGFAPDNAKEAAIYTTLGPGDYTAIVSGVGGTMGVGIVEVVEVDLPQVPLINISTRGSVLTGNDVMIGGFIINGTSPQTVLIRARGPSLGQFGIANPLADPTLDLVIGTEVITSNDNWQSAPNVAAIQATGKAPTDPRESAILVTLYPGTYTAIVRGAGGTTGVGIIEVFAQ